MKTPAATKRRNRKSQKTFAICYSTNTELLRYNKAGFSDTLRNSKLYA